MTAEDAVPCPACRHGRLVVEYGVVSELVLPARANAGELAWRGRPAMVAMCNRCELSLEVHGGGIREEAVVREVLGRDLAHQQ